MTFANRNRGGTQVYARSLLASLRDKGDVVAWVIGGPNRSNLPRTLGWLARGARRALNERPPDLLHCPSFVAPWRVPVPYVVTVHDAGARRFPADHPLEWRVYDRRLLGPRLRGAARVITGSEFARDEVVEAYGLQPGRVVVVPYGLDAKFTAGPPTSGTTARGSILFPGAPVGRKNLDAVLECMASAGETSALRRAKLEISGATASQFPVYARLITSLGLQSRVRWLGHLPAEELRDAIAGAAVVAYPSLYEGFGFPPLEAMALGTPVVASDRGSLPEVLDGAALLVDPTDRQALSAALESVLASDDVRERLRQAGMEHARHFTWARCAEQTSEVYRDVLAETRGVAV